MKYPKSLDEFFGRDSVWKEELAQLRDILLQSGLEEKLKWGQPCYCLDNKNIVGLGDFKSYFGIWFFQGALLSDPEKILLNAQEGKTKAMRQWRMKGADEINAALILDYVNEAIENQKAGKIIAPQKKANKRLVLPAELKGALKGDNAAQKAFEMLTAFKQREYAEYISTAKRESTKESRIAKILPMIKDGKGLNDIYR